MVDDLFGDERLCDERTELLINRLFDLPINYVGNKKKLIWQILEMLRDEHVEFNTVFDAFSGSCVVSLMFNRMGKNVISNDLLAMSSLAAVFYLEARSFPLSLSDVDGLCTGVPSEPYNKNMSSRYKWRFFLPAEADMLDRFRSNLGSIVGGVYTGMKIGSSGAPEPSFIRLGNGSCPDKSFGSFAMHSMCTHVLQKCFLGGRYYNGQTICKLRTSLKRGRTNKNVLERGNDMRTIMHKLKNVFLPDLHPARNIMADFVENPTPGKCQVFNCDVIKLLESNFVNADVAYFDPPYGGESSDYGALYGICEEYVRGCDPMLVPEFATASGRFKGKSEYRNNFEILLNLSKRFPVWLFSFNESSYSSIEDIVKLIKKFRSDIVVRPIKNYGYNYRKKTNSRDRESEWLILARA